MEVVKHFLSKMSNVSKPRCKFLTILLTTMMYIPGKINYRNLSRYSDLSEMTYLRNFRRSFAFNTFNQALIQEAIPPDHQKIAALDCSFIDKSGKKTYGIDRFFSGTASRTKQGLEISDLAILDVDASFGYSLSVYQTPPISEIGKEDDNRMDHYLTQIEDHKKLLEQQGIKYIATDGFYSKQRFIDGLCEQGFHQIGKLRADANLRYLYQGPQKEGPGAPRRYDGKVYYDDFSRWDLVAEEGQIYLYTAVLNAPRFKRNLRVVCLLDQTNPDKPKHTLFFSTDLDLEALSILTFYRARFQIEFLFRDAKQFTGLCDGQAQKKKALDFHFNASMTALNLLRFMDRTSQENPGESPCSIASWKTKLYNQHLLERFIQYLDLDPELIKIKPGYQQLNNYGVIAA